MCCRVGCGFVFGQRDFTIEPGEAVEFSRWTPHWFGAHGERLHLHS